MVKDCDTVEKILKEIELLLKDVSLNGDEDIHINIKIENKITNYFFKNKKRKNEYIN